MLYEPVSGFCFATGVEFELEPPHAFSVSSTRKARITHIVRLASLRLLPPSKTIPESGASAGKICKASHVPAGLARESAAPAGTLTFSANGTAAAPGVIVAGVKAHIAPSGRELCKQESVIGCRGLPVLAFNESE